MHVRFLDGPLDGQETDEWPDEATEGVLHFVDAMLDTRTGRWTVRDPSAEAPPEQEGWRVEQVPYVLVRPGEAEYRERA